MIHVLSSQSFSSPYTIHIRARLVNTSSAQLIFLFASALITDNADQKKQICHFLDGNGKSSVPQYAENGKQPKGKSELQLNIFKQKTKQEDQHADQNKAEKIVLSLGYRIIQ